MTHLEALHSSVAVYEVLCGVAVSAAVQCARLRANEAALDWETKAASYHRKLRQAKLDIRSQIALDELTQMAQDLGEYE